MERKPRAIHNLPKKGRLCSAVHKAILDRRFHNFRILVDKMGEDCNVADIYGWTPLILSCLIDDEDLGLKFVKVLKRRGAVINYKDPYGRSALHYCCIGAKQKIAKYLTESYEMLDYQSPDRYGYTPLMYASMRGKPCVVLHLAKLYAESGNSVDETDPRGRTPLIIACKCGNYASAEILLTVGKAEKYRRDDVLFQSPAEWLYRGEAERYAELSRENDPLFRVTIPLKRGFSPRLARLLRLPDMSTIYDREWPYICDHTSKQYTCNSECLSELTIGIPEMFTHFHLPPSWEEELYVKNQDSRNVLLAKLEDRPPVKSCTEIAFPSTKPDSLHSVELGAIQEVNSSPPLPQLLPAARCTSTARLIELRQNQHNMMIPDLTTLFKLYVPQDPDDKKPAQQPEQVQKSASSQVAANQVASETHLKLASPKLVLLQNCP